MPERLALVALIVPDYDEALAFFVGRLGFELREDSELGGGKRWVRIGLPGASSEVLLSRAVGDAQTAAIGNQGGGRVWLFLETEDFDRDFAAFTAAGVKFEVPPRDEPYGRVAVFQDPWGNRWDLIQHAPPGRRSATRAP
jgi:catechol 2,3-dioxygenase-like lactoylglutathione lyase family enzyme